MFDVGRGKKEKWHQTPPSPLPTSPARKQKHQETKSTFHLPSLFVQRFQGQKAGVEKEKTVLVSLETVGFAAPWGMQRLGQWCSSAAMDAKGVGPGGGAPRTGGIAGDREASGRPAHCLLPAHAGSLGPRPLLLCKRTGFQEAKLPSLSAPCPPYHARRCDMTLPKPGPASVSTAHRPYSTSPPSIWLI